jgi:hypothetical protein
MTTEEAIQAIYSGQTVDCTADEYSKIRQALQEQAGRWIDQGDQVRSHIALSEVKRLDHMYWPSQGTT